jgi:lysozyme family protein
MTVAFDNAFYQLIGYEGGSAEDAGDRGGQTRWGISKRSYPTVDVLNLTLEQAKQIYLRDYWAPMRLDEVRDGAVAAEIFEQAVNFGLRGAAGNLQTALHYLGLSVKRDGVIGPETLAAVNQLKDAKALLKTLNGVQFMRYLEIVSADPAQKKFARGWLRRVAL